MKCINGLSYRYRDCPGFTELAREQMESIQGTIQRVDYQRRELWVIAQGRAWRFMVAADCYLWFDDTPAVLRCFHPLDPVTVIFRSQDTENFATAIYSWEPQPVTAPR